MPKIIRTFVAAKIEPTPALRQVIAMLGDMGRPVKSVAAENLHVTLKFLGETDTGLLPDIKSNLKAAVRSIPAFELKLTGTGAFPNTRRPSVVWMGLQEAEPLIAIAGELQSKLQRLGFPKEQRKFEPHLTLARIKSKPPELLALIFEEYEKTDFGSAAIGSVELIQSELTPAGARYTVLESVTLVTGKIV